MLWRFMKMFLRAFRVRPDFKFDESVSVKSEVNYDLTLHIITEYLFESKSFLNALNSMVPN